MEIEGRAFRKRIKATSGLDNIRQQCGLTCVDRAASFPRILSVRPRRYTSNSPWSALFPGCPSSGPATYLALITPREAHRAASLAR